MRTQTENGSGKWSSDDCESISKGDLLQFATGQLAASLYPSSFAEKWFAMLTAYYDESGTHEGSPINVLAGLCGDVIECARFEREWNKVLVGFGIPYVRAKSLFHRQKIFKGWSRKRTANLIGQLLYVIQEHPRLTITKTVLKISDYDNFYRSAPNEKRQRLDSRYALCVRSCLHFIARMALEHGPNGQKFANFLLEAGHRNAGDALRVWKEVKAERRLEWSRAVGTLSFGEKTGNPLLQAADLLAYSIYRFETSDHNQVYEDDNEPLEISEIEFDMEASGLIITNHLITKDDLLKLRFNMKLQLPNRNVFEQTHVHFDRVRYFGWRQSPADFDPIIVSAKPEQMDIILRQIPPRSMTKNYF